MGALCFAVFGPAVVATALPLGVLDRANSTATRMTRTLGWLGSSDGSGDSEDFSLIPTRSSLDHVTYLRTVGETFVADLSAVSRRARLRTILSMRRRPEACAHGESVDVASAPVAPRDRGASGERRRPDLAGRPGAQGGALALAGSDLPISLRTMSILCPGDALELRHILGLPARR